MFWNNWRKPWWIVFLLTWVGLVPLGMTYGFQPETSARIALAVASGAAGLTWYLVRLLRRPPE